MLRYFSILILFSSLTFAQTAKASFIEEVEVPSKYIVWHAFVIDSLWLNKWLPNGDLPRRENATYRYWMSDVNSNLIPIRKIDYRLPMFQEHPVTAVRAITDTTYFWNQEQEEKASDN